KVGFASRHELAEAQIAQGIAVATALRRGQVASNGELSDALTELTTALRQRRELTTAEQNSLRLAQQIVESNLPGRQAELLLKNEADLLRKSGIMAVAADKLGTWASLAAAFPDLSWNHTAYVVESVAPAAEVGGHNIDAPVLRFKS